MGQAESKRSVGGSSVASQNNSPAHHPVGIERAPTPTLKLPLSTTQKSRRHSDAGIPESTNSGTISKQPDLNQKSSHGVLTSSAAGTSPQNGATANPLSKPSASIQQPQRSPRFSLKNLGLRTQSTAFQFPILIPSLVLESLPERRSRRKSSEQGPINMKSPTLADIEDFDPNVPRIPPNEIFVPPSEPEDDDIPPSRFRGRASTIANGQIPRLARPQEDIENAVKEVMHKRKSVKIHVVFRYHTKPMKPKPKRVFVAGTMTDWKSLEMGICAGESDFNFVIDCSPGKYHYKFCVDNDWCIDESQPFASYAKRKNSFGTGSRVTKANVITVKPEDFEVFEALACDSFATRIVDKHKDTKWGQQKPNFDAQTYGQTGPGSNSPPSIQPGPPILPPLLLNIILNKQTENRRDPVLLPEPTSHVMFNHLYAQSIRDEMLVMATTTRIRKKCVTVIYYKPL